MSNSNINTTDTPKFHEANILPSLLSAYENKEMRAHRKISEFSFSKV